MIVFSQSAGTVTLNGRIIAKGWAGNGAGKCNPAAQAQRGVGPLPRGTYTLGPWEENHGALGRMVSRLIPDATNEEFGRDGFFIHGPSMDPARYGQESKGCIVLPRLDRLAVRDSHETRLQVVA